MNQSAPGPWRELIELARRYPSPHNSQPIVVKALGPATATLHYDLDRGLPAENFGIPFAHVCAGVFLESLRTVAAARGWALEVELDLAPLDFEAPERLHLLGHLTLTPQAADESARRRLDTFLSRRTSRRPYLDRPIDPALLDRLAAGAAAAGFRFESTQDPELVKKLVRINQATLFSDLRNDAVHTEIMTWLRFSKAQAAATADGLSAETMLMPGRILRLAMSHRSWWDAPVLGSALRWVYLRTMRGVTHLGWMSGRFAGPADYVDAGRAFMDLWLKLTAAGLSLHPFGTVITNPDSHRAFVTATGIREPAGEMAWMLFRFGHSAEPPPAHRRSASAMLIDAGDIENHPANRAATGRTPEETP